MSSKGRCWVFTVKQPQKRVSLQAALYTGIYRGIKM